MLVQTSEMVLLAGHDEGEESVLQEVISARYPPVQCVAVGQYADLLQWVEQAKARQGNMPRVILLDLRLPKLNGLGVLRTLRLRPELSQTYIVATSAQYTDGEVVIGYRAGANLFVRKPKTSEDYAKVLQEIAALGWIGRAKMTAGSAAS